MGQCRYNGSRLGILNQEVKHEKDIIYSSDLTRALDTAKEFAKFHAKAPLKFVKDLRELDWGELEGKNKTLRDWDNLPDSVESNENLFNRAKIFLESIKKEFSEKNVLIVGHKGIDAALILNLLGKNSSEFGNIEKLTEAILDNKFKYKEIPNVKPIFRLNPPKKGYEGVKRSFVNKGALGYRSKEINKLIERMI